MKDWKPYTFNEAVDCNPKVTIKKGDIIENCEMEDINPNYKYLYPREGKLYKGSNSKFQNGDTVFARITPCLENGKIAQVKGLKKNCGIGSTEFFVFRGKKNVSDSDFVFYLTKTNLVRDTAVNSMTGASGRQRADIKAVKKIKVQLPPLPTQQRIASILSAYDDLIEVNNQRIKLLEQTARELYKEWFVRMRFPGYKQAKFKKGVPVGWEVVRIDTLYKTSSGGTPSREKIDYYENGIYEWIKTGELNDTFVLDTSEKITEKGLKNSSAKLFPPYTTIFAMYGNTIGQLGITTKPAATNQAACALLPLTKEFGFEFIFLTLLQFRETIIGLGMGAAQQNVSQDELKKFKILKPTAAIALKFKQIVNPFFLQIETLQNQNTQLRQIRDRLLPRLINGKLQVSEAAFSELKNEQD